MKQTEEYNRGLDFLKTRLEVGDEVYTICKTMTSGKKYIKFYILSKVGKPILLNATYSVASVFDYPFDTTLGCIKTNNYESDIVSSIGELLFGSDKLILSQLGFK